MDSVSVWRLCTLHRRPVTDKGYKEALCLKMVSTLCWSLCSIMGPHWSLLLIFALFCFSCFLSPKRIPSINPFFQEPQSQTLLLEKPKTMPLALAMAHLACQTLLLRTFYWFGRRTHVKVWRLGPFSKLNSRVLTLDGFTDKFYKYPT